MNKETIKGFINWAEDLPYLEVVEVEWCVDEEQEYVMWGLVEGYDGEYDSSSEVHGRLLRKDGLVIINTDNGCGETITMLFLESKEIK